MAVFFGMEEPLRMAATSSGWLSTRPTASEREISMLFGQADTALAFRGFLLDPPIKAKVSKTVPKFPAVHFGERKQSARPVRCMSVDGETRALLWEYLQRQKIRARLFLGMP